MSIQSVSRASAILKLFREHEKLSIAQIALLMNLSKTTVHGLVKTLEEEKLLQQDAKSRLYSLGHINYELGMLYQSRIVTHAVVLPWMKKLSEQVEETVQLATLTDAEVIYLSRVTTQDFYGFSIAEGLRMPAHCTSTGKCMLATLPVPRLMELYPQETLLTRTPQTIATRSELLQQLQTVAQAGYAIDDEEAEKGLRGIAIPLLTAANSAPLAICISGTVNHMTDARIRQYLPALQDTRLEIARLLGNNTTHAAALY
ncbi:IclR family transcriptional regulator [Raoultella sp. BIGb0138]|nr:IclR family transcriptional regulator [Raoultella sp. BIGb0138]